MLLLRQPRIVLLTAGAMLAFVGRSNAQLPAQPHLKVELISEEATSPPGQPLWVGLLFQLDQGWHIYWQNAGDSGQPPKVQWEVPPGFMAGSISWPQPIRLGGGSVVDYGYEGQVLLMAPIQRPSSRNATPLPDLSADVKYIVCRDVCIPGKAHLTLSGPGGGDWAPWHALFEQTRAQLPKAAPASWKLTAVSAKQYFILSVQARTQLAGASFFPLEPSQIDNSSPQDFAPTHDGFRLTLKKSDQLTKPISRLKGLIVLGPSRAIEVSAPVASQQAGATE
jgi:DsbC/DsbD-like thiol-disulfide interchange protein